MEQPKNNQENPEEKLKDFREEIRLIVEEERANKKTAHFNELNPEELTPEDLEIWEKVKDESITREDFDRYRKSILTDDLTERREGMPPSKTEFMAFIANKAGAIFLERDFGKRPNKGHQ